MLSRRFLTVIAVLASITVLCLSSIPNPVSHVAKDWGIRGKNVLTGDRGARQLHPIAEKTFLLMKTGIEVAYKRLPPHVSTTFSQFPHHAVYADTNDTIDGTPMIDCLQFLDNATSNDDSTKSYRIRRQAVQEHWHWKDDKVSIPENPRDGWNLDRFKNIPAFAHAWLHHPGFDWYVMVDADTYMSGSTLQAVTEKYNPDEPWYFGRSVGRDPAFAHGGSGIVSSRRAMEMMFGHTQESIDERIAKGGDTAIHNCCGDSVTSFMFADATGLDVGDTLEISQTARFQGGSITNQYVTFKEWCNPVGSFHKLPASQISELNAWELSKGLKTVTYADFYYDFVMPDLASEKPNWNVDFSNEKGLDHTTFSDEDDEKVTDKAKCIDACKNDHKCTMWVFRGNESCTILRESICTGKAMTRFAKEWKSEWSEVTTGYMIDRIRDFRVQQNCNPDDTHSEGWRFESLHTPGDIRLSNIKSDVEKIRRGEE